MISQVNKGKIPASRKAPGVRSRNAVLAEYKRRAPKRGLVWELTDEEFDNLIRADCHYCGCPPSRCVKKKDSYEGAELFCNGIDRKDNMLGYTTENTVTACSICNQAKHTLSYEEFTVWLDRIIKHWSGKK